MENRFERGRACLEAAFMYGLFARAYGNNNLPDSSNMCHETTSVALPESIGVPVVTFNPLRERRLVEFTNPQSPAEMLSGSSTRITSQYHQVRSGGDTAAIMGIAKALFALERRADSAETIIDRDFIRELRLTVNILTKLSRSALVHGGVTYILPCLGRIEMDEQATGRQAVAMEDLTGCMHGSWGQVQPASPHLLSEPKIIAEFAKAAAPSKSTILWDDWVADYCKVREAIAATYPDTRSLAAAAASMAIHQGHEVHISVPSSENSEAASKAI